MTADLRDIAYVQPARCLKHPQCDSDLFYCFICNRVCCRDCRIEVDEGLHHKTHKTSPLAQFLNERSERIKGIKVQLTVNDSQRIDFLSKLEEAKNTELQKGFSIIDQLVYRLKQQVDTLETKLKSLFKQQAELVWAAAPHTSLVNKVYESNEAARTYRETLEHEMRRAELDELQMAEGSRELDALADRLAHTLQFDVPFPASHEIELTDLKKALADAVAHFEATIASARDKLLKRVLQPAAGALARFPTIVGTGIINSSQLKTPSDRLDPYILGIIPDDTDSILVMDGWNASLKSLNLSSGAEYELYYGPPNVEMAGLIATSTNSANLLLTVEVERPKGTEWDTPRTTWLLVFKRERTSSQLATLLHKLLLPEKTRWLNVTFSPLPNGNALLGVIGFTHMYEVECSPSQHSRAATLSTVLKPYQLPLAYRCISGFRVCGQWNLVASFEDDSVRVFSFVDGLLAESCRLALASCAQRPFRIIDLLPGVLLVRSEAPSPDNSWTTFLDLFQYDARGCFSPPSRLLEHKGILIPLATLPPRSQERGSIAELVALDHDSKALRFYDIV